MKSYQNDRSSLNKLKIFNQIDFLVLSQYLFLQASYDEYSKLSIS